jgi:hypothetical protein
MPVRTLRRSLRRFLKLPTNVNISHTECHSNRTVARKYGYELIYTPKLSMTFIASVFTTLAFTQ